MRTCGDYYYYYYDYDYFIVINFFYIADIDDEPNDIHPQRTKESERKRP